MGIISSEEVFKTLSKNSQNYVKHEAEVFIKEYKALRDIRNDLGVTQNDLAEMLEIKQKNISSLENRKDIKLSTLRNYLHALGGELIVSARFPNEDIKIIESLSD